VYTVQIALSAQQDLLRLKAYLENEFGREVANEVLRKIIGKIKNFEEFPLIGKPLSNRIDLPTDYMYLVIEKNYIFYRIEDRVVRIIRILDTRQDFMRILFDK